ncbi:hypothetical protein SAMN02745857_03091 [Andreprevotia lacus DSM 23236]|jgi:hypothetical protein|uniref:Uncharacterized protein n=1 Tax=Andreprevotia lacus DSM 23236 TaxID=1121001 RepID=A0A1W1XX15_9NEIS|nr:hypothetical protein [Andreprevotia lacus]SMC28058.1 hypothetical protein SAMN02745857_03091 [Andreprevotia lacus DSM 23236]
MRAIALAVLLLAGAAQAEIGLGQELIGSTQAQVSAKVGKLGALEESMYQGAFEAPVSYFQKTLPPQLAADKINGAYVYFDKQGKLWGYKLEFASRRGDDVYKTYYGSHGYFTQAGYPLDSKQGSIYPAPTGRANVKECGNFDVASAKRAFGSKAWNAFLKRVPSMPEGDRTGWEILCGSHSYLQHVFGKAGKPQYALSLEVAVDDYSDAVGRIVNGEAPAAHLALFVAATSSAQATVEAAQQAHAK